MDIVIILLIVAIFVCSIFAFLIGKRFTKKQEIADNQKILAERELIQQQIEDGKKRIVEIEQEYESKKQLIIDAKENAQKEYNLQKDILQKEYAQEQEKLNNQLDIQQKEYLSSINKLNFELQSLKSTRDAAIAAARKEQSIKDQPETYCFPFQQDEIHDIEYLNSIKSKMRYPEIIGKVIWSSFMQKKFNAFAAKILNKENVCGVYKITDQLTQEAYIGQSVNIMNRWKEHLKAGIGASAASASNQLYAAMRRDGIENFSFELLEECSREELNTKEKFFIDLYSTNTTGLNITKGGS